MKAAKNPIKLKYDERKCRRMTKTYDSKIGAVTVPEEHDEDLKNAPPEKEETTQEEIQWLLLKPGSSLDLDVWVARNDRNRRHNEVNFQDIPRLRRELPRQFDDGTNRTIERIDVLWLHADAIIAAFEGERTTAIYSGLLRMSDLVSMQPNFRTCSWWHRTSAGRRWPMRSTGPHSPGRKLPLLKICRIPTCSQAAAGDGSDRKAQIAT